MIRSFRLQVTAWYVAFFSILLITFSLIVYGFLARSLEARLDETLITEARTAAALFQSEMQEMNGAFPAAAHEAVAEMRTRGVVIAIFSEGRLLEATEPAEAEVLRRHVPGAARTGDTDQVLTIPRPGSPGLRVAIQPIRIGDRDFLVASASSLDSVSVQLQGVRRVLYIALPLALLIAGLGGFLLADRSLRPLFRMTEQAHEISARNLSQRLQVGRPAEELSALAASFNELLSRLDASFGTMRRFIADASHELRTPVAVIRGEADVALSQERAPEAYKESLAVIQDEAKRLTRLVDDLLNLARADAGHARLRREEFYLDDVVSECCRAVQSLAAAKGIQVEWKAVEDLSYSGDEDLLRRLVFNLLDNAIRYTPGSGKITVLLSREEGQTRLTVSDTGVGIAPAAAPHIFERFYRGDDARSRQSGGFGLGLAIVKWIAEAHNGSVGFTSDPGAGSTFEVVLPVTSPAPAPRPVA